MHVGYRITREGYTMVKESRAVAARRAGEAINVNQ